MAETDITPVSAEEVAMNGQEDLISRKAAIKAVRDHWVGYDDHYAHCMTRCIPKLLARMPAVPQAAKVDTASAARRAAEKIMRYKFMYNISFDEAALAAIITEEFE